MTELISATYSWSRNKLGVFPTQRIFPWLINICEFLTTWAENCSGEAGHFAVELYTYFALRPWKWQPGTNEGRMYSGECVKREIRKDRQQLFDIKYIVDWVCDIRREFGS